MAQNLEIRCWNLFDPFGCFAASRLVVIDSSDKIQRRSRKVIKEKSKVLSVAIIF
jgi:hypothetical protein